MGTLNHTSPFRYPGGKSWFIPFFKTWANSATQVVEPFAGGASVSLSCLVSGVCRRAILIEIDPNIAAVWQAILGRNCNWLVEKIRTFNLNEKNVVRELSATAVSTRQRAWQTLLLNRISHGGIIAKGAGRIRQGEDNKGIASRWYPKTLIQRIACIHNLRRRISFRHEDGIEFVRDWAESKNVEKSVLLVDPPYPVAGRRLYDHWQIDHNRLLGYLSQVESRFIATYENLPEIKSLAAIHGLETRTIRMRSRQHRSGW